MAWPLCFTYAGSVIGKGFVAHVDLCGRLLAIPEADGVWLHGVSPAAVAVGAPTLSDANLELRDILTKTFIDFANDSESFAAFKVKVEEFYHATDEDAAEWQAAVASIKAGTTPVPEGVRRCPDSDLYVRVSEVGLAQLPGALATERRGHAQSDIESCFIVQTLEPCLGFARPTVLG